MEDSEMRNRAERFLDKLEVLGEIVDGYEYEIEHGILMLGASAVANFVRDAGWACGSLGYILSNVMDDVRVRLPKPVKEDPPPEESDAPGMIRFPSGA